MEIICNSGTQEAGAGTIRVIDSATLSKNQKQNKDKGDKDGLSLLVALTGDLI